jgi:hypothetical protein
VGSHGVGGAPSWLMSSAAMFLPSIASSTTLHRRMSPLVIGRLPAVPHLDRRSVSNPARRASQYLCD